MALNSLEVIQQHARKLNDEIVVMKEATNILINELDDIQQYVSFCQGILVVRDDIQQYVCRSFRVF